MHGPPGLVPQPGPHWPYIRGRQAFGPHALLFAFPGRLSYPSSEAGGSGGGGMGGCSVSASGQLWSFVATEVTRAPCGPRPLWLEQVHLCGNFEEAGCAVTLKRKSTSERFSGDCLTPCQRDAASASAEGRGLRLRVSVCSVPCAELQFPAQARPDCSF